MKKLIDGFEVFVFDLDNTLVYLDFNYAYNNIISTIKELNGIIPDQKLAKEFWFAEKNRDQCIQNHFDLLSSDFWRVFRKNDIPEERIKHTKVFNGVNSILKSLVDNGKELAIITNATIPIAIAEIRILDTKFTNKNVLAVGENPRFISKPHRHSLDYLKLYVFSDKKDFVYIGDSHEDSLFASNAKIPFVHFNINNSDLPFNFKSIASFNDWEKFDKLLI